MQNKAEQDRNQEATVYLGNLDENCTDALVWELMLQAGPVSNVFLPKDRISMAHQGFGFCEFLSEDDAEYACKIMNQIKLFGKPIRVNKASYDKKQLDVGANLFIGSLDGTVDENALMDTFSRFGGIAEHPKVARDPSSGESRGYGFVSFNEFEAADMAIENMNGQFLGGKQITVQYAFKKDGKGERHGTEAERLLAAQAKKHNIVPGANGTMTYQGRFAGALAAERPGQPTPGYPGAPPPPPGMPVYQPSAAYPPAAPAGFPSQPPYAPPPPAGYPSVPGYPPQPTGYPSQPAYPGPPPGFPGGTGANGYGAPGQGYGQPPMPPMGYPQANGQPPPPPPPIRMGFGGPPTQG